MVELVHTISQRIARYLEKVGLVEHDMENSFLNLPVDDEDSLLQLQGASQRGKNSPKRVNCSYTLPESRARKNSTLFPQLIQA
jgi:hypothetical protein